MESILRAQLRILPVLKVQSIHSMLTSMFSLWHRAHLLRHICNLAINLSIDLILCRFPLYTQCPYSHSSFLLEYLWFYQPDTVFNKSLDKTKSIGKRWLSRCLISSDQLRDLKTQEWHKEMYRHLCIADNKLIIISHLNNLYLLETHTTIDQDLLTIK